MCAADGNGASLDIGALGVGQKLSHGLYDPQGRLLLSSGTVITEHFLEMLRSRGIRRVQTQSATNSDPVAEQAGSDASTTEQKPAAAARPADAAPNAEAYAFTDRPRPGKTRLDLDAFEDASQQAVQRANRLLDEWQDQGDGWLAATRSPAATRTLDAGPTADLLHQILPIMTLDVDLAAVMVNLSKPARQPILTHGVRTALVAMHLAQQVGYPEPRIIDAGLTGLLADLGMARLPEKLLRAQRPLTPAEWLDVRRHPAYSADLLENAGVPNDVRIAIYQHHERIDGSGYPHGRKGFFLHPLARLVAVADTYAALAEPRHHRAAQSVHHAVKAVLIGVKAKQLDSTVGKLLVDTVGLFPVGLRVDVQPKVNDATSGAVSAKAGHIAIPAQVLRSPEDQPDRPFVVVLDEDEQPTRKKIDLAVRDELLISKVYAPDETKKAESQAA
ncbi:MAG: HD domain-containing phosphohydrolase [Planctomycetota bacterium]